MQGTRPARVADQIRVEVSELLSRDVKDPGIGFVTITWVKVSADLQAARVYYTSLGDERAQRETKRALDRATPYLRRQIAGRLRLRRAPELTFQYDQSVAREERVEQLLEQIRAERATTDHETGPDDEPR
jgi:ribosome-binding factor A